MKNSVREELRKAFSELILGPVSQDETLGSNPSDTYLTGILWPRGSTLSGDEDDAGSAGVAAANESDGAELGVPGYRAIRPCTIGMTFSVLQDATVEISLADTARYDALAREKETSKSDAQSAAVSGKSASTKAAIVPAGDAANEPPVPKVQFDWKRRALGYRVVIDPKESRTDWRVTEFMDASGNSVRDSMIALDIKRRLSKDRIVLTVTLINMSPEVEEQRDIAFLFQAGFRVRAVSGKSRPAILPRPLIEYADDEDSLTNLILYRDVREYATGHGIGAQWAQPLDQRVEWIETAWLPEVSVKGMSPEGHSDLKHLQNGGQTVFSASWLAREAARTEICAALEEFCSLYGWWIQRELEGSINTFTGDLRKAADGNLARCRITLERMRRGIEVLRTVEQAWIAFSVSNAAMDKQSKFPSKGNKARSLVWRPFQLAFFLMVIPSLVNPKDGDRDTMDLLWFPTGGGKTEAYLALTAFAIFVGRLRSTTRRKEGGVDVLMRYTLRLLTVQQFQRAAALIAACDAIRVRDEGRFGTARISIGLYVGGDSTPNSIEDGIQMLELERNGAKPNSTPRQLLRCPVCGGELSAGDYRLGLTDLSMEVVCPSDGCETRGSPLPIMTVDQAIYAHPPSLVIGTVDKFAQLPRRTDIRNLFGLDGGEGPGLIIQDELHLISGPLGSMSGLYESVIEMLCSRKGVRPKLIGSTATIGRAEKQVRALFDRRVLQFPPPGFDAADSFFAVRDESGPDRLYLGVASAGRSPKFALQAVLAALLQSTHTLLESGRANETDIDPYWTCVAYFNSLRELGGAHVLMLDDVPRQMQFLARRQGASRRILEGPAVELSSRVPSNSIPEVLLRLEQKLGNPDVFAATPEYAVLASNMISVGVDVPRLGLMAVNGQPKSTAEYIQATSRIGRGLPGLVVTLYNFGRPRDVSHFEHFGNYHGALYRGVEATSVTPWAPRARDKALHAVLIAAVRHLVSGMVDDEEAVQFDAASPEVAGIVERLCKRAESASEDLETKQTRADLEEIIRVWGRRSEHARATNQRLRYWERKAPFGRTAPHLMRAAEETRSAGSSAWPTPNSMREVEPSTAIVLKNISSRKEVGDGDT